MNAPLPQGLATADADYVIAREIQAPMRTASVTASAAETGATRSVRPPRRRRRSRRDSDHRVHNHMTERWMVSYADFITLLFAFFVVMYAMSSVNEGRYRVLSGALSTAFSPADGTVNGGGAATMSTTGTVAVPAQGVPSDVKTPRVPTDMANAPANEAPKPVNEPPVDPVDRAEIAKTAERVQHMTQLATKVDERLQALVRDGQVHVTRGARGIAIEINAEVLFDPAKAELKPASFAALHTLATVLSGFVEPLQIEGHSDDVPIATREFKSNWELSAARASSVARFLIEQGVPPNRIGVAGYAEFRPLTGNVSAESRARNRRVTLLVLSADDTRPKEGGTAAPDEEKATNVAP